MFYLSSFLLCFAFSYVWKTTEKDASNRALSDQAESISLQYSREPSWGENRTEKGGKMFTL